MEVKKISDTELEETSKRVIKKELLLVDKAGLENQLARVQEALTHVNSLLALFENGNS